MMRHSVNNNTCMGLVISLFKFKPFDQFNTPKLPQSLDIYSGVGLQLEKLPSFKVIACSILEFRAIYLAVGRKHPPPGAYKVKSS